MLGGVFTYVLGYFHRTKVRTAHGAEVRSLGTFLRQSLVVKLTCGLGIKREIELIFPTKFKTRLADGVVAVLRAGVAFGEVGGVRGDLIGDDAVFNVLFVRQT